MPRCPSAYDYFARTRGYADDTAGGDGAEFAVPCRMGANLDELPREGELVDGRYRIDALLGVGGMAAVFEAKQVGFERRVALKFLLPACARDPQLVARFLQEGRAAIRIRGEHIVRIFDVCLGSSHPYLVMECLDGEDLEALVRRKGPLALPIAVDLLLQACEALGEAHALGIVHRDLKPANLFLTRRADGSPCVKVLDFGIAKMPRGAAAPWVTRPSLVMGSPHYMSPEQTESSATVDQRSDIWSLGTTLYKLLSGHIAFDGETAAEISAHVLCRSPVALAQRRPEIPRAIDDIVSRCLEKAPARRYASIVELARALAPFGTPDARSSAESIARILHRKDDTWATGGTETIRPLAAEVFPVKPLRPRRTLGYVIGSALSLSTLGAAGTLVLRSEPLQPRLASPQAMNEESPFVSPPVALSTASAAALERDAGERTAGMRQAL